MARPLVIAGSIGSPYTRKMRALLRYRRIPFRSIDWNSAEMRALPKPPLPLMPCIYLPTADDGYEATSDSSLQIRALEARQAPRSVIPADPAVAFLDYLVEDYADEWLTKAMFYYRWGVSENVVNASKILPYWNLTVSDEMVEQFPGLFGQRQIDRLSGVVTGSLELCGPILEASYRRLLGILREHFSQHRFVFGTRPSAGDFGLFGQLTQLVQVEPTSMALCRAEAPRVLAWVDVVEDLSGATVQGDAGWLDRDELGDGIRALLAEIGRTYAPFLVANAKAREAGEEEVHCTVDGQHYWQRAFAYQQKCLGWLRHEYRKLGEDDRHLVDSLLAGTGCEAIVSDG